MFQHTPSIFTFKRGDHICVFYDDHSELLQTICPYLVEGLLKGERCFCVQQPGFVPILLQSLASCGIDVDSVLKRRALEIHTQDEVYRPSGKFEPNQLMKMLETSIRAAREQRFTGLRTAGELSWAANGGCACDQLVAYEQMVDSCFPDTHAIGMCQYRISDFSADVLDRVLASHRLALLAPVASRHAALRVRYGRYQTDIIADRLNPRSRFYFVVQQTGKKDVLGWGSASSFDAAVAEGQSVIDQLQPNRGARTLFA